MARISRVMKNALKRVLPIRVISTTWRIRSYIRKVRSYELVTGPLTYNQDGLATVTNCGSLKDESFVRAYTAGKMTGSWELAEPKWRAYVICWAADKAKSLEGDFVECGVNKGGFSLTAMTYTDFATLNKKFYLLDTFCGLADEYISEEEKASGRKPGGYEECYESVKRTFKRFENVVIIKGQVPDTLHLVQAEKISFLSIDMNCAAPEIAAAEFFWDRLVSGAVIVLDDYGWLGYEIQKEAFDKFAAARGTKVLSLPTGQGLIFKP